MLSNIFWCMVKSFWSTLTCEKVSLFIFILLLKYHVLIAICCVRKTNVIELLTNIELSGKVKKITIVNNRWLCLGCSVSFKMF